MGYRGEDLDLRTPQTWTAAPAEPPAGPSADMLRSRPMLNQGVGRSGPIWVDDVVLACSNHAFDVALAHRSAEVRLEHLLHALTRIDLAADVLESYGVRVGQLRRDSATIIASEIPVGLNNSKAVPRRSEDLEDILRMAAGLGARRNAPAGVEDLLAVLLDAPPELPGVHLIQRNLNARSFNAYAEATPPMARNPYTYDPMDMSRERMRGSYQPVDPMMRGQLPSAPRADYQNAPVDSVQNSRLDSLEQMVRSLGLELQNERKMLASVLQDVQREVGLQRDDASRLSGGLHDKLQSALGDRLQALENAVINVRPAGSADLGPLFDRLTAMERTLQSMVSTGQRGGGVDLTPVINRLDIIEEAVLSRDGEPSSALNERLENLDEFLASERRRAQEPDAGIAIDGLKGQFDRQRGEIAVAVLTPLTDRINTLSAAIEGRDEDVARDFGSVNERLLALEKSVSAAAQKSFDVAQGAEQRYAESQKSHGQELGEVHDALMKLNANQHTLAGSVEQWRREGASTLGGFGEKLGLLGANVDGFGTRIAGVEQQVAKPVQMLETLSGTMDNMHRVTVERYYRRNRFWYWLFGTDDWVVASWPSQAERIVEELKSVKTARARG